MLIVIFIIAKQEQNSDNVITKIQAKYSKKYQIQNANS